MKPTGQFRRLIGLCPLIVITAALALSLRAAPASATNNCLQDVTPFHLNCTANDVSLAKAVNIRDLSGNPLSTCFAGSTFSFIADFQVVTTATSRENVGFYIATGGQANALTGQCTDNIDSPLHFPGDQGTPTLPGNPSLCTQNGGTSLCLGSALYHEFDTSLAGDNCGDTTSADGTSQFITIEVDNIKCPTSGTTLSLPNCTSWQQPGGASLCISNTGPSNDWPWVPAAIPGAPSKCSCEVLTLPITPITYSISTTKTPNPASLQEPGGNFTYTVGVTNTTTQGGSFGSVTINQICDDKYGTIAQAAGFSGSACPTLTPPLPLPVSNVTPANCGLPVTLAVGQTVSNLCSFTGTFSPGTEGS